MELIQAELRELFDYDATSPLALRWRKVPPHTKGRVSGDIAGYWHSIRGGTALQRRYVDVNTKRTLAHRVVWVHQTGTEPPRYLGFLDDDCGNIRIENLGEMRKRKSAKEYRETRKQREKDWRHAETGEDYASSLRRLSLRRNYGITPEDYGALLASQAAVCAICRRPETMVRHGRADMLSVDHCHDSKRVRGLLCSSCNNLIGRAKDDPVKLRAAAEYLERHVIPSSSVNGHG